MTSILVIIEMLSYVDDIKRLSKFMYGVNPDWRYGILAQNSNSLQTYFCPKIPRVAVTLDKMFDALQILRLKRFDITMVDTAVVLPEARIIME